MADIHFVPNSTLIQVFKTSVLAESFQGDAILFQEAKV